MTTRALCGQVRHVRRDVLGYALVVLVLCLLPLERWVFAYGVRVSDFALALALLHGLTELLSDRLDMHFPLASPMWLVILASLVATLVGFGHANSLVAMAQEVYLFSWFVVLANQLAHMGLLRIDGLMKVWSMVALVEATATLMGMFGIGPAMFYSSSVYGEISSSAALHRAIGTFLNPNAAASYLSVSLFVLLATGWSLRLRSLLGAYLFAGICATGSMGALLSTLIALVVLPLTLWIVNGRRLPPVATRRLGLTISVVALAATVLTAPIVVAGREVSIPRRIAPDLGALLMITVQRLPRSVSDRMDLITQGWNLYMMNPLGTGPDTAVLSCGSLHNDYVAFLFERGPLGAIGWLWMVGATLLAVLRASRRRVTSSWLRQAILSLGAGFLACAVNAFTHEVSHFRQLWLLMALLYALSFAAPTHCVETCAYPRGHSQ